MQVENSVGCDCNCKSTCYCACRLRSLRITYEVKFHIFFQTVQGADRRHTEKGSILPVRLQGCPSRAVSGLLRLRVLGNPDPQRYVWRSAGAGYRPVHGKLAMLFFLGGVGRRGGVNVGSFPLINLCNVLCKIAFLYPPC